MKKRRLKKHERGSVNHYLVHDAWLQGEEVNGHTLSGAAIDQVKEWFKEKRPVFLGELKNPSELQRYDAVGEQIGEVYIDDAARLIIESDGIPAERVARIRPVLDVLGTMSSHKTVASIAVVYPLLLVQKEGISESGRIELID